MQTMHTTVDYADIARAACTLTRLRSKILGHHVLWLEAVNDGVTLTVRLQQGALCLSLPAITQHTGICAMDAGDFHTRLATLSAGPITLFMDEKGVHMDAPDKPGWALKNLEHDLPTAAQSHERGKIPVTLTMPAVDFLTMVDKTIVSISSDTSRNLNNTLLEWNASSVRLVATDGHRLAMASVDRHVSAADPADARVLIPRDHIFALRELGKSVTTLEPVTISRSDRDVTTITLGCGHVQVGPELRAFPEYNHVIPQAAGMPLKVTVNRRAFHKVLVECSRRLRETRSKLQSIILSPQLHELGIGFAIDGDVFNTDVACTTTGEGVQKIGFNVRYLLDTIKAMGMVGTVELELSTGAMDPIVMRTDHLTQVVMPMRI